MTKQITVVFDPPQPTDTPEAFDAKAFAVLGQLNEWSQESNEVAQEVSASALAADQSATAAGQHKDAAAQSATLAQASADAASSAAGASKWISGQAYAEGQAAWSPINMQTYRRITAGAGSIDPSLDPDNWAPLGGASLATLHATALSF